MSSPPNVNPAGDPIVCVKCKRRVTFAKDGICASGACAALRLKPKPKPAPPAPLVLR